MWYLPFHVSCELASLTCVSVTWGLKHDWTIRSPVSTVSTEGIRVYSSAEGAESVGHVGDVLLLREVVGLEDVHLGHTVLQKRLVEPLRRRFVPWVFASIGFCRASAHFFQHQAVRPKQCFIKFLKNLPTSTPLLYSMWEFIVYSVQSQHVTVLNGKTVLFPSRGNYFLIS